MQQRGELWEDAGIRQQLAGKEALLRTLTEHTSSYKGSPPGNEGLDMYHPIHSHERMDIDILSTQ